jgi:Zn-dependent protease with chaperone function
MISIRGFWHDGVTSQQTQAVIHVFDNGAVRIEQLKTGKKLLAKSSFDIKISPRIANTPRCLTFTNGASFETQDNDSVDTLLDRFQRHRFFRFIHRLESYKRYILLSIVALIVSAFFFGKYGVPAAARIIALNLPTSIYRYADEQTLRVLDRTVFGPSQLKPSRESRIRNHFKTVIANHPQFQLNILFRKGGERVGVNAFALPYGTIIFTDEMVKISRNDDELIAVLVHEVGHVVHRHAMRTMIQDSLLAFALLAITGDASGTSELFLALPVILTELAYSREFEREADRYALEYLKSHQIPPSHFTDLLRRIKEKKNSQHHSPNDDWLNYLSTHPNTEERLKQFEQK